MASRHTKVLKRLIPRLSFHLKSTAPTLPFPLSTTPDLCVSHGHSVSFSRPSSPFLQQSVQHFGSPSFRASETTSETTAENYSVSILGSPQMEEKEVEAREREWEEMERAAELLQELQTGESEPSILPPPFSSSSSLSPPPTTTTTTSSTTQRCSPLLTIADVSRVLENTRARDVAVMDVTSLCDWTDWMVVATGHSTRHLRGVADALVDQAKSQMGREGQEGEILPVIEGRSGGEWVAVDCGSIVVNIFLESTRSLYKLERLWTHKGGGTKGGWDEVRKGEELDGEL